MNTTEYPSLGARVNYLRSNEQGEVFEGEGTVQAIFLDPNKRIQVQVKDKDNAYNVEFFCINPTDDTRKEYENVIAEVQEITKKGNDIVQKTVELYNSKVAQAYDGIIGAPVEIDLDESEEQTTH